MDDGPDEAIGMPIDNMLFLLMFIDRTVAADSVRPHRGRMPDKRRAATARQWLRPYRALMHPSLS